MTNTKTTEELQCINAQWDISNPEFLRIWEIFKGRCLLNPAHQAMVIHEIEYRSQRPKDWNIIENRVLLCSECHNLVHKERTAFWKCELTKLRKEWMETFGK